MKSMSTYKDISSDIAERNNIFLTNYLRSSSQASTLYEPTYPTYRAGGFRNGGANSYLNNYSRNVIERRTLTWPTGFATPPTSGDLDKKP